MESKIDLYWLWFDQVRGLSLADKEILLRKCGDPLIIYLTEPQELSHLLGDCNQLSACFRNKNLDPYKRILDKHQKLGIKSLTPEHPHYRPGCGFVCFYKGTHLHLGTSAAVVGTRKCSADGYYQTQNICQQLVDDNICVNSGLALGIDYWAHVFTLRSKGKTQAFLASGLDRCYPLAHQDLFEQLVHDSAVISPFPAGNRPLRHHFWTRNKWLACLSDQVIVTEAPARSGALITAKHALAQGKKVYTVKPEMHSERCAGNMYLLKNGAAAWPSDRWSSEPHPITRDPLLQQLRTSPQTFDQLGSHLKLTRYDLEAKLLQLESTHWVTCQGDGLWRYNGW